MAYPGFISGPSAEAEENWCDGMKEHFDSFNEEAAAAAPLEPSVASSDTLHSMLGIPKIVIHPPPEDVGDAVVISFGAMPASSPPAPLSLPASGDHLADSSSTSPGTPAAPPVLPPSVEMAYKKKCVELKRRMNEVEESNDALRLRKVRLQRSIRKIRLERAILLDALDKRLHKNGEGAEEDFDYDSAGSSEEPPTPQEKPLRSKRPHRRPAASPPPTLPSGASNAAVPPLSAAGALPTHTNGTSATASATALAPLPNQADDSHTFAPPTASRRPPLEAPKETYDMFSDYLQSDHMQREKQVDAADMKQWILVQWESLPEAVREAWQQKRRDEWAEYQKEELVASLGQRKDVRLPRDAGHIDSAPSNATNERAAELDREDVAMEEAGGDRGEGPGGFTAVN